MMKGRGGCEEKALRLKIQHDEEDIMRLTTNGEEEDAAVPVPALDRPALRAWTILEAAGVQAGFPYLIRFLCRCSLLHIPLLLFLLHENSPPRGGLVIGLRQLSIDVLKVRSSYTIDSIYRFRARF